jgi:hypothetical protein
MKSLALIVLIATLASVSYAKKEEIDQDQMACLVHYLKSKDMLSPLFRAKFNATISAEENPGCGLFLTLFNMFFYSQLEQSFQEDEDLAGIAHCLTEQLRKNNFGDITLKNVLYEGAVNMPAYKRKTALAAIEYDMEKKIETSAMMCLGDEFGEIFDSIAQEVDTTKGDDESEIEDYCLRKYALDHNWVDASVYNIVVNPHNVDVSHANCDETIISTRHYLVDAFLDDYQEFEASKTKKKCVVRAVIEHQYFKAIARAIILAEAGLGSHYDEEKALFVSTVKKTIEQIMQC